MKFLSPLLFAVLLFTGIVVPRVDAFHCPFIDKNGICHNDLYDNQNRQIVLYNRPAPAPQWQLGK
jgi:hypothetical protein